jgi:hypothetical protein
MPQSTAYVKNLLIAVLKKIFKTEKQGISAHCYKIEHFNKIMGNQMVNACARLLRLFRFFCF